MVGFVQNPTVEGGREEEKEDLKIKTLSDSKKLLSISNDPLDLCLPELEDFSLSFSNSYIDFDSINDWFIEGNSGDPNMADLGGNPVDFSSVKCELGDYKESVEIGGDGICKKDEVGEKLVGKEVSLCDLGEVEGEIGVVDKSIGMGSEGVCEEINVQGVLGVDGPGRKLGDLGCWIEQQMGKVSLDGMKVGENVSDEDESGSDEKSEGESSSASSSSSSSSSSDEEDDEDSGLTSGEKKSKNEEGLVHEQIDVEDGEIMLSDADETVAWSDNDYAEEDIESGTIGPIMSKNELKVLPPVPSVNVTLQPHHETQPVGTILSVIGPQVIVEGVEKHNPLNEGSILWITESRSPLGMIDEIFGPVKNPYYIVRYNAESEVPSGIQQGTLISFVPEFAKHVLNNKSLYQKGYDASGENDEELSDELEFSDDEKEAEYKRMLKMKKRGTNESSKPGNRRKEKRQQKNQTGNWNRNRGPTTQTPIHADKTMTVTENQHLVTPVAPSLNQDNYSSSSGVRQDLSGNQALVPPFPQRVQAPGFCAPNGIWNNGFPPQQMPPNGMLWMQQNGPYQFYQIPLQTNMGFQQQMSTIPGLPLNFNPLGGQSNFGGSPTLGPWPTTCLDQNNLNASQFGMALQGQHASMALNGGGEQAVQPQGSQISPNFQPSPANLNLNLNFNQGRGGGRGHHRGGRGRFGGGRGRYHQSH